MKNVINRFGLFVLTIAVTALTFQSCKKKYDEPPTGDLLDITANATIADIKALHAIGDSSVEVTEDKIIEGVVISSDETGNFFKQLIIQDATGGLEIRIEQSNLYNDFPVGRQVFVKCKGLYVGDYQGNHQLGAAQDTEEPAGVVRLPEALAKDHIIPGALDQTVTPNVVTVADLTSSTEYRNTLVQLQDAQFSNSAAGQPYANAAAQQSENREIITCAGGSILLRSSGFADFATELTPTGNGTITAVHTMFGSDAQLYIRDVDDIDFNNSRCTVSVSGNLIPIATLRAAYTGAPTSAPTNSRVKGYVISDRSTGNIVDQNLVVMDENANGGILVRFSTPHTFDLGDYIEFAVDGGTLDEYNQLLQLEGISSGNISVISSGNAVPPTTVSLTDLLASPEDYESTLVKVNSVNITGDATFGFNEITDGTNFLDLYTSNFATFTNDPVPTTCQNVSGIVGQFNNDYQLTLRNPSTDLEAGTNCQGGSGGCSAAQGTQIDISALRAQYSGTGVTVSGQHFIKGVVISDDANGNIVSQNIVVQDGTAGITVRFTSSHGTFAMGDSVEVIVTGATLDEYNGLLQVEGITVACATQLNTGNTVTPQVVTVATLLANPEDYESELIQVTGATISGDATYGFNDLSDGTGTIDMYTRSAATFSSTSVPTGTVNVTGILGQFDNSAPFDSGYQITIRNTSDVQ